MRRSTVQGLYDGGYFHGGPVVPLPAEVCAVPEANPDVALLLRARGLELPHRLYEGRQCHRDRLRSEGRAVTPDDQVLMRTCPLRGGVVSWAGFKARRRHAIWQWQVEAGNRRGAGCTTLRVRKGASRRPPWQGGERMDWYGAGGR